MAQPDPPSDAPLTSGPAGGGAHAAGDRPRGAPVPEFVPPSAPDMDVLDGRFVTLERLDPARHAEELFVATAGADEVWDYMGYGPFGGLDDYRGWQAQMAAGQDPVFFALRDRATGRTGGLASFMRIDRTHGVIEIGHILIAPVMQRTPATSEAILLMIRWAFEAGYRRVEWKCDRLNAPSMRAAARYGFTHEGVFRQHMIVKGRNRDTAWWAITDADWPGLHRAHQRWLAPENLGHDGRQRQPLASLIAAERAAPSAAGYPSTRAG